MDINRLLVYILQFIMVNFDFEKGETGNNTEGSTR
jgi:hypothetical protein